MTSCIAFIKIAGTDKAFKIQTGKITSTLEFTRAEFTIQSTTQMTGLSNATVEVEDVDGNTLFYGKIYDYPTTFNTQYYTYQLMCEDARGYYKNLPVKIRFKKGTTVSQALSQLISTYTSDAIATDETDETICELSFNAQSLSDAILGCLSLLESPCAWSVTWSGVQVEHHFKESWVTNVGTLSDGCEVLTGDFQLNVGQIRNSLSVMVQDLPRQNPHKQYFWFEKSDFDAGRSGREEHCIYLDYKPVGNMKAYLIVGNWSTDFGQLMNLPRYEMKLQALGENAQKLLGLDIDNFLKTGANYLVPQGFIGSNSQLTSYIQGLSGTDLTTTVKNIIAGKFEPDLSVYFMNSPINGKPESEYGCFYAPNLMLLKRRAQKLRETIDPNINGDMILGYLFTYQIGGPFTKTFENATSISTYGTKMLDQPIMLNTDSLDVINLYGKAKVARLSSEVYEGQIECMVYKEGTRVGPTFYPNPGDFVDFTSLKRGSITDVSVYSTDITFDSVKMIMYVSSQSTPDAMILDNLIKGLETGMKSDSVKDDAINSEINKSVTLTLTNADFEEEATILDVWDDTIPLYQIQLS